MGNKCITPSALQVSKLMTLNQLVGHNQVDGSTEHDIGGPAVQFRVPIYQRLYVWKKEQIERLLNDIFDAWKAGNADYYIGGTLVVESCGGDGQSHALELIDGQQRLTTLLLTALYRFDPQTQPGENRIPYRNLLEKKWNESEGREPRLHFEIRDKANIWFKTALKDGLATANKVDLGQVQTQYSDDDAAQSESAGGDNARDGGVASLALGVRIIEEWFRSNSVALSCSTEGQCDFDTFLLNNVQMLVTSVPDTMDLNHLFETINDRSVQLEHHEVLKARMLKWLRKNDEQPGDGTTYADCARIWEACSAMDDYWEDALAEATGKSKANVFREMGNWEPGAIGGDKLSPTNISGSEAIELCAPEQTDLVNNESEEADSEETLQEIIRGTVIHCNERGKPERDNGKKSKEKQRAKSLISFPMLLLHTLRIWIHRYGPEGADLKRFDSLKLLVTFDDCLFSNGERQHPLPEDVIRYRVKTFIKLLWEIRYLLDQHVIRWVEQKEGGEWGHRILRLESAGNIQSLRRAETEQQNDKELSLLQSMLYHSQDIRQLLWLTPLLGYLHARTFPLNGPIRQPNLESTMQHAREEPSLTAFMRHLDNGLFSSPSLEPKDDGPTTEDSGTLLERSRAFLEKPWRSYKQPTTEPLAGGFHGTDQLPRTSHYWYYKVDFILWRQYQERRPESGDNSPKLYGHELTVTQLEEAWKEYRFTARTSVEHIHPQTSHEAAPEEWADDTLHSFGNLALVSRERNSAFSNLPYHEKRGKFMTRLKLGDLQSPKLAWVYLYDDRHESVTDGAPKWHPTRAREHLKWIESCVERYFSSTSF